MKHIQIDTLRGWLVAERLRALSDVADTRTYVDGFNDGMYCVRHFIEQRIEQIQKRERIKRERNG